MTLSEGSRDIVKEAWDAERFGQVCTKPESFSAWKRAILKLCRQTGKCDFETKEKIQAFGYRLEEHSRRVQEVQSEARQ